MNLIIKGIVWLVCLPIMCIVWLIQGLCGKKQGASEKMRLSFSLIFVLRLILTLSKRFYISFIVLCIQHAFNFLEWLK